MNSSTMIHVTVISNMTPLTPPAIIGIYVLPELFLVEALATEAPVT